jgi:hypothetical protein
MSDIYGPSDGAGGAAPKPVAVIDGPCGRKLNNAITMRFLRNGTGEPFATALQSGNDGVGKKLGVLFGFKNGAAGTHTVTYADDTTLAVPVVDLEPTHVTRGDGSAVCTITRGETTAITAPDGSAVLTFLPDPVEPKLDSCYRLRIEDGSGVHVATMDVIRQGSGYEDVGVLDVLDAVDFVAGGFVSDPGGSLALPFLGTRIVLFREPTPLEQDALLAASVEIGIAVRPYVTAMGARGAAWT